MIEWEVRFDVRRPLAGFARPRRAGLEQVDHQYRIEGRRRRGEGTHALQLGLAGRGRFRDAAGERWIEPGDAFLTRVDDPAVGYGHGGGDAPWRFVFIAFYGAADEVATLNRSAGGAVHRPGLDHPLVARLQALERYAGRSLERGSAALLVHELLAALADPGGPRSAGAALIDRAQAAVSGPDAPTSIAALAAALGVSREHLARAFRAELGLQPSDWLLERQLQRACAALRGGDDDLETIATASGLGSASRLCKCFRRVLGCTPTEYRRGRGLLL